MVPQRRPSDRLRQEDHTRGGTELLFCGVQRDAEVTHHAGLEDSPYDPWDNADQSVSLGMEGGCFSL